MIFLFLLLLICCGCFWNFDLLEDEPKGAGCAGCTIVLGLMKGIADYREVPVKEILDEICTIFKEKPEWEDKCDDIMALLAPFITYYIEIGMSPDEVCREIDFCKNFKTCRIYPPSGVRNVPKLAYHKLLPKIMDILNRKYGKGWPYEPVPLVDEDGDRHSTFYYGRGTSWTGKDCDDSNAEIHPGRKERPKSVEEGKDYNCNGIHGIDEESSNKSYEELYCEGTDQRGFVAIGDSACAHFHIPASIFYPNVTFEELSFVVKFLMDEFDWPQLGMYGGHENDTTGFCPGPVQSMYLQMKHKHNRCNHRDFQTICVNGARSSTLSQYAGYIGRNQTEDYPLLINFAFIGDDVCFPHHSFERMTTPEEFYKNIMEGLTALDNSVPEGSFVVMIGLVKGTVLYEGLWNRTHPLGDGVTYADVYDYLNCLYCNPCWGWLNTNVTIRNTTQKRADELNSQYHKIMQMYEQKQIEFKNFKLYYISFEKMEYDVIVKFIKEGKPLWKLAEPVDGFHPSQLAHYEFSKILYNEILKLNPES